MTTISFDWNIHWVCDYDCPYCWFHGEWEELGARNAYFSPEIIIKAWSSIHRRYGRVKLSIIGGEPLIYPGFQEIIGEIARLHDVEISTNLSRGVEGLIKAAEGKSVVVNPSFHSLSADPGLFIGRVKALKEQGLTQSVTYLAWPPLIGGLGGYKEKFAAGGIDLVAQPFHGIYEGVSYPGGYSETEKEILSQCLGMRGGRKYKLEPLPTKGKLCAAGRLHGVIDPDGAVKRCGGRNNENLQVGNIYSDNFSLLTASLPCASETCACNEWVDLLET